MGLEYVGTFHCHRLDPQTPLTETVRMLDHLVHQGRALYVGISSYPLVQAQEVVKILNDLGTPCVIYRPRYLMFERSMEDGLLDFLQTGGVGSIAFSPLTGGQLTDRYLDDIPTDSHTTSSNRLPWPGQLTTARLGKIRQLSTIAGGRGQKLPQVALVWILRKEKVTSALIGAGKTAQLDDTVGMLQSRHFGTEECVAIDAILAL